MSIDNPYQNLDITTRNPFTPTTPEPTDTPEINPQKTNRFSLPHDPKIKLLLVLGAIIAILSVFSLILTVFRKSQLRSLARPTSTPAPVVIRPTDPPLNPLPTDLNSKFDKIDQNTKIDIQFNPPKIDLDIGL